jgi:hypothetical protein
MIKPHVLIKGSPERERLEKTQAELAKRLGAFPQITLSKMMEEIKMPRLSGPRPVGADVKTVRGNRQAEDLRVLKKANAAHNAAMQKLRRAGELQETKIPGAYSPDEEDQE